MSTALVKSDKSIGLSGKVAAPVILASDPPAKTSDTLFFVAFASAAEQNRPMTEDERLAKFMLEWLLELKCTYTKIFYGRIKLYYYDQIQGIMALRRWIASDFVVRIPKYTCIQRYLLNRVYWNTILKPKMSAWYFQTFVPRLVMKQMGRLEYGETETILNIRSPNTICEQIAGKKVSVVAGKALDVAMKVVTSGSADLGFNLGGLCEEMINITPEAQALLQATTFTPKTSFEASGKRKWGGDAGASKTLKKSKTSWGNKKSKAYGGDSGGRSNVNTVDVGFNMGDF